MAVPLRARGESFGALTLARNDAARRYDERDLQFAMEVGRRASGHSVHRASAITFICLSGRMRTSVTLPTRKMLSNRHRCRGLSLVTAVTAPHRR